MGLVVLDTPIHVGGVCQATCRAFGGRRCGRVASYDTDSRNASQRIVDLLSSCMRAKPRDLRDVQRVYCSLRRVLHPSSNIGCSTITSRTSTSIHRIAPVSRTDHSAVVSAGTQHRPILCPRSRPPHPIGPPCSPIGQRSIDMNANGARAKVARAPRPGLLSGAMRDGKRPRSARGRCRDRYGRIVSIEISESVESTVAESLPLPPSMLSAYPSLS